MPSIAPPSATSQNSSLRSPWVPIQRALESTAGAVFVSCLCSGQFPATYVTEGEHQIWEQSEHLAEAIGLEICSWMGNNRSFEVRSVLRDESCMRDPDINTQSVIFIPLRLTITPHDSPDSRFSMDPPPIRLFSRHAVWSEAISDVCPYLATAGIPDNVIKKATDLLERNLPTKVRNTPSGQFTDCWFRIGPDVCPLWRQGGLSDCTGTLRGAAGFNSLNGDGKPRCMGPLTILFDTLSSSVIEVDEDMWPSLAAPPEVAAARASRGPVTRKLVPPTRASSAQTRWWDAVRSLQQELRERKHRPFFETTIERIGSTLKPHVLTVKTVVPEQKRVAWRFDIDHKVYQNRPAVFEPYHSFGTLSISGEVESDLGTIVAIEPVTLIFDTATRAVSEKVGTGP